MIFRSVLNNKDISKEVIVESVLVNRRRGSFDMFAFCFYENEKSFGEKSRPRRSSFQKMGF